MKQFYNSLKGGAAIFWQVSRQLRTYHVQRNKNRTKKIHWTDRVLRTERR